MLAKTFIIIALVCIFISLGMALYFLFADGGKSKKTAYALTIRITLSITLFVLLLVAYFNGWFAPHDLNS